MADRGKAVLADERFFRLRQQLLASVRRSCPAWLADHAEDLVQTSLIRLLGVFEKSGENVEPSSSYLNRVAYAVMVDEMRRHFRRKEVQDSEGSVLDGAPAEAASPDRRAASMEIQGGIRGCLAKMLRSRRMAVACHLQGYTAPETARFLGWTSKKAEHLIYRGLEDLRECLARKGLAP